LGLFQGRLGFRRTIVLRENGGADFSNISGLTEIKFPKRNLLKKSEEIKNTLAREGIV
jgi:hypothetical protein